jgi:hypothetical protein
MKKRLVLAICTALLLGLGCGKNKAVKAMDDWADEVCACETAQCALDAANRGTKMMQEMRDVEGTESDLKAITAAGKRAQDCARKLRK